MAKLVLDDLASLSNETSAITTINNNSAATEAAMEKTLSRDGASPNQMEASLDMNSNRIINLPDAVTAQEPATLSQLQSFNINQLPQLIDIDEDNDWGLVYDVSAGESKKFHWSDLDLASGGGLKVGTSPITGGIDKKVLYDNNGFLGEANLFVEDANTLAQRNLANAQTFRLYNTTDAGLANYERFQVTWSSNFAILQTTSAGTGTPRELILRVPSSLNIYYDSDNHLFRTAAGSNIFKISSSAFTSGTGLQLLGNGGGASLVDITHGTGDGGYITFGNSILIGRYGGINALLIDGSGGNTAIQVLNNCGVGFYSDGGSTQLTGLIPEASNILAQRNGTSAQTFRIYGTFTDASNNEYLTITHGGASSGNIDISSVANGTGAVRDINIVKSGARIWKWDCTSGHYLACTDNSYDIGASGANRPRHLYIAGNLTLASNSIITTASGDLFVQPAGNFRFGGGSGVFWQVPSTGHLVALNDNQNDIGASGATRPRDYYGAGKITSAGATAGIGYATGAGGTVTQITSRTTGVTLNKVTGAITLISAAGSTTFQSFTLTNSAIAATDVIVVHQKSGTDLYEIHVTNTAAGTCQITFRTTGGTTTEQPVFNFAVIKGVTS